MTGAATTTQKVAVVSGGSRGLGRTLVERLLGDGWRVATFSRTVNEFIEDMTTTAGDAFFWEAADLAEPETTKAFAKSVTRRFGRIDMLINNAGLLHRGLLLTLPSDQIETLVTTNLTAPLTLTQACARAMVGQGEGQIINISSVNAIRGYRGVAVYSAAKGAMDRLTPSLARELGPAGIRVNSVVPGFFDSDMTAEVGPDYRNRIVRRTPLGRLGTVDDVANAVMYLTSQAAGFITGQTLIIDGGITC